MTEPVPAMTLRTKKFALQALLDRAAYAVPSRDILPVLKNFRVEAADGSVTVAATDMELAVIATSEMVQVVAPGSAVFPAKRLLDIVREAPDGDLTLEAKDGTGVISVGRTYWSLKLQDAADYPALPVIEDVTFHSLDRVKLLKAIASVRYAAATDTYRQNMMLLDITNSTMRAADGIRFQQVALGQEFPLDIQIPIGAVDDLVKTLQLTEADNVEIGEDEDHLFFRVVGQVFVAQKLNATFPDVDGIQLKPALANEDELFVGKDELVAAIRQVRITADPDTSAVLFKLSEGKLEVTSKDKYGSWSSTELDVGWKGGKRVYALNHAQLLDMLKMSPSPDCHFYLGQGKKSRPAPLLLRTEDSIGVLNQVLVDWI